MRCVFKSFISAVLVMFTAFASWAQGTDSAINTIHKEFEIINADTTMKMVVMDAGDFMDHLPDAGGTLTGYYKDGKIRKIVRWVGISIGTEVMEYYFKNNRLLFVYEEFNSFHYNEASQTLQHDSLETSFVGRYYFAGNKLIDYVTTGHNRFENDTIDPEATLLKEAMGYRKKLAKRLKP